MKSIQTYVYKLIERKKRKKNLRKGTMSSLVWNISTIKILMHIYTYLNHLGGILLDVHSGTADLGTHAVDCTGVLGGGLSV